MKRFLIGLTVMVMLLTMLPRHAFGIENADPNPGDQIAIEGPPPLEEPAEPAPISEDPAGYAGVPASNPQTGDETSLLAMGIAAALSAAGIAFCLPGLRKQRKKDEE